MNRFVITGLPRSRTAWFSAYLTQGDVICYHEAIPDGIELNLNEGTADCGYAICPIPCEKLVIIHRDWREVSRSLSDIGLPDEIGYLPILAEMLYDLNGLHVDFCDINDRLEEIHNYLGLPGYSRERAELFINMNIQSKEWSK